MVIGMDVTHPTNLGGNQYQEGRNKSIVGAVASYSSDFGKFASVVKIQERNRMETILQAGDMVKELANECKKLSNINFQHVLFFRDGVSDSQFNTIERVEIPLVRKALAEVLGNNYALTYIIVQKRVALRYALENAMPLGKRMSNNPPQGTVIDTTIVEMDRMTFYLTPHNSPKGTSKPAKFIVMTNDKKFTANEIQRICYVNCATSIRTRNSIRTPIPIDYADRAAYRAKEHLDAFFKADPKASVNEGMAALELLNANIKVHPNQKKLPYYC